MAAAGLTITFLVFGALEGLVVVPVSTGHLWVTLGADLGVYLDRTASWLTGDGFYLPRQLAGPYEILRGDALYPPPLAALMTPFVWGLPLILWWAIPLSVVAISLRRLRPAWWAWPILAAILVYPRTWIVLVLGKKTDSPDSFGSFLYYWPDASKPQEIKPKKLQEFVAKNKAKVTGARRTAQ